MSEWQPIKTAPTGRVVRIRVDGGKEFDARLWIDAAMTEDELSCDQWQAEGDDYPECWSEGCCWESNADEVMSRQPTHWREIGDA